MRAIAVLLCLAACGGDDQPTAPDAGATPDAAASCPRTPGAADRARKVVVSHPFGADQNAYEVLDLATDGTLAQTGTTFDLGRSTVGEIAFTPDGEVGLVVQEDGSIGVFRFDGDTPAVVDSHWTDGDLYATSIVMDPGGAVAYVLDDQWRENGGGVYRVAIGCDGALTSMGLWFASKLPGGLAMRGDRFLLAATDVDGSTPGDDAHSLDRNVDPPARTAGVDAFGDDDDIVGSTAITNDQQHFLIGDNNSFGTAPNRVAVVGIGADGDALAAEQLISPLEDPIALLPSPFGDVVLAVSGFGNAVFVLTQHAGAPPFTNDGELTYTGAAPQLPGGAVQISQGTLRGLALVAENLGVRRIQMAGGGTVTDLGLLSLGSGSDAITGSIGVQP
jgi:hypothetical protein